MFSLLKTLKWAVLLSCFSAAGTAAGQSADVIIHNAVVYTVDAELTIAEAIAVGEEKIVAVGSDAEVLKRRDANTRVIDAKGRLVLPGFNDTHVHFGSAARFLEFNIMAVSDQDVFVRRIKRLTETLPDGQWITGGLWGAYDQWSLGSSGGESREPFAPDMRRVADISADHPIFIRKFDDSEFAVNRAALRAAGVDPDELPQLEGIEYVRDAAGQFTGRLRGRGVLAKFRPVIPRDLSRRRRLDQTRHAMQIASRFGVTSLSDMSDDTQLEIYRELHDAGQLDVRVHFRFPLDRWAELAGQDIRIGSGDPWIRLGGLKGHIDGIMGTSSARFFEPYSHDPTNRGRWRRLMVDEQGKFVEGKFLQYMLDADKAGLQLTVHAIGDEANSLLLDYLEELNRQNGPRDRRFRLVHAQVIADKDFSRLGQLGVLAEVQPYHLSDDMRWMEQRIGSQRCRGAYAFRRIQRSGARLCFGSDWPGTSASEYPINPLLALYAATTRQTVTGQPEAGWFPGERIDMPTAIAAHTINGAYSTFEEDIKGSLEPGKLADLVMLSDNLLEIAPANILQTRVLVTIVGGRIVYEAAQQ